MNTASLCCKNNKHPQEFSPSLPVSPKGGPKSLWQPFHFRHIPLPVLLAGRGDVLPEGGSDRAPAVPRRLFPEPHAGRGPGAGPLRLDGRHVRRRGEGGLDGQRSSEVSEGIGFFHMFCTHPVSRQCHYFHFFLV